MRIVSKFMLAILIATLANTSIADDTGHRVTVWEVKGEKNSVYLLGSIHLLRSGDYPLPAVLDTVYEDAEVIFMEVDMDDLDPIASQAAFTQYGMIQDGKTLQDLMGPEYYSSALVAAEKIDIPLDMLQQTEPWYAAMTVEIMMLGRIGFNPTLGVEMHMMSRAVADGKPIEGFETIEEQLQFLDNMSLSAQREMLLSTLEESTKLAEIMDQLIDAWRHGDLEFLETGLLDELAKQEELNKVLVVDRNHRWVEEIEPMLDDDDDYLIVVGALHLVGNEGVPRQLAKRGFAVHQLSETPPVR